MTAGRGQGRHGAPETECPPSDAELRIMGAVHEHGRMGEGHERGRSRREQIFDQVSGVLDPLAVRYRGWPVEAIEPMIARAWRREFGAALSEVALADTAMALRDGRPWCEALWTGGW